MLVDGVACLFETGIEKITLGYHYRRKRIQGKYGGLYGAKSRARRKVLRKLRGGEEV